ncbi:zinc finger BED domain-containing protein RICESLEEPER 2-like [Capsicum annuum]
MGKKVGDEVETYLKNLFAFYVRKYSKGSKNNSSSSRYTSFDLFGSDLSNSSVPQSLKINTLRNKLHMKRKSKDCGSIGGTKLELDKYLGVHQEPVPEPRSESKSEDFDISNWWKVNSPLFSVLSQLAHDVLAIPVSRVVLEYAFSIGGRILDPFRSSLTSKYMQCLICVQDCVQDWLRQETSPICVEENLEFLEKLELGKKLRILYFCVFLKKNTYLCYSIPYLLIFFLEITRSG